MKVALYARVSTESQDPELQLSALRRHAATRDWTIVEEFADTGYSGAKERRPALDRLMTVAWTGAFQAVVVWRFDRFARSVKHLITAPETFRTLKVDFISLQEQFDTSTPIGQAMFTIIGAMAQLERDIIPSSPAGVTYSSSSWSSAQTSSRDPVSKGPPHLSHFRLSSAVRSYSMKQAEQ